MFTSFLSHLSIHSPIAMILFILIFDYTSNLLAVVRIPFISTFTPRQSLSESRNQIIQSPSDDDIVINAD